MKRLIWVIFILLITLLGTDCNLQYADKQFINFDSSSSSSRIRYEEKGAIMIFRILIGDTVSARKALYNMKMSNKCTDLKNIDIEYFDNYYYVIGFPKLIIKADCIISGATK